MYPPTCLTNAAQSRALVWTLSGVYGFAMAPIWGSLWCILGEMIEVTGVSAVVVSLGSSIGDFVVSLSIGNLMASVGAYVLPLQNLVSCLLGACVMGGITAMCKHVSHLVEGMQEIPNDEMSTTVEMDSANDESFTMKEIDSKDESFTMKEMDSKGEELPLGAIIDTNDKENDE